MVDRVTDFCVVEITITEQQYYAFPAKAREMLRSYGHEIPQGFGKPTKIEIARYRLDEIADACGAGVPSVAEAMREMAGLGRQQGA